MNFNLNFKRKIKNNKKSKSIKSQVTFMIIRFVLATCLLLGIISSFLNYKTANHILLNTIEETAKQTSKNISSQIRLIQAATMQTGCIKELSDPNVSIEEKQQIMTKQEKLFGLQRGKVIAADGYSYFNGDNYSDREYFKVSITGKEYMSSPIKSKVTGQTTFVVSAPLWENGVYGSNVVGVVTFVPDENFLNNIVEDIKISENSYAYLINSEGTTIADRDHELVGEENVIQQSKTNEKLKSQAEADQKLVSGQTGSIDTKINGDKWVLGYSPVNYTDGWGMGVMAKKSDFFGPLYTSMIITIISAIVLVIISFIAAKKYSNTIGNPLKACSERLKKLAKGDLNSDVPVSDVNVEIDDLTEATSAIVNDLREMLNTLINALTEISNGNLNIDVDNENLDDLFANDFNPLLTSIHRIVEKLNTTLSQINIAGEQVTNGANQVSEGAQVLSQGATEQASSIEELSATINDILSRVEKTAENTIKAKQISEKSSVATLKGQQQMQEMVNAIDEISSTSNEIGKIIKDIDDIAFQTNILALNAAVEAARAGEAGKGFSVVADEVRNLAAKSAESSKNTSDLIDKILIAIDNGSKIVNETAVSLEEVVSKTQESSDIIQHIADASNEQALFINQVNTGVEQISVVVQTNSATAEESAAASEELSSQAQSLKELIDHFDLKE